MAFPRFFIYLFKTLIQKVTHIKRCLTDPSNQCVTVLTNINYTGTIALITLITSTIP